MLHGLLFIQKLLHFLEVYQGVHGPWKTCQKACCQKIPWEAWKIIYFLTPWTWRTGKGGKSVTNDYTLTFFLSGHTYIVTVRAYIYILNLFSGKLFLSRHTHSKPCQWKTFFPVRAYIYV